MAYYTHWKLFLFFQLTGALITKNFEKIPINAGAIIVYKELVFMPLIEANECAYFCMKEDDCHAFYITDEGSCRQVPIDLKLKESSTSVSQTILYAAENVQFSEDAWVTYRSKCYNILEDVVNYYEASSKCEEIQAKLYEPFNENEDSFLLFLVNGRVLESKTYWIGINDIDVEDKWVYSSSGQAVLYTIWQLNEPDDYDQSEDCVSGGWIQDIPSPWYDRNCNDSHRVVCELKNPANCGESNIVQMDNGVITSPNFPNDYEILQTMKMIISVAEGSTISLVFEEFDIEFHPDCLFDSITIYDGGNENAPEIGTFCGNENPLDVKSSSHQMLIKFYSDRDTVHSGFKATFNKVEE